MVDFEPESGAFGSEDLRLISPEGALFMFKDKS
jgi:hypothetical protein